MASQVPHAMANINIPTYNIQYAASLPALPSPYTGVAPIVTAAESTCRTKATHINFQRAAELTAEVDKTVIEPSEVVADIRKNILPALMLKYPGLSHETSGMSNEEAKFARSMAIGFSLALAVTCAWSAGSRRHPLRFRYQGSAIRS